MEERGRREGRLEGQLEGELRKLVSQIRKKQLRGYQRADCGLVRGRHSNSRENYPDDICSSKKMTGNQPVADGEQNACKAIAAIEASEKSFTKANQ